MPTGIIARREHEQVVRREGEPYIHFEGVAGHGLMVFAQKIIPIGTIGISQIAQPALALVWSFLLLGERLNEHQTIDIAIVLSGLLAFLVMNQRANRVVRR